VRSSGQTSGSHGCMNFSGDGGGAEALPSSVSDSKSVAKTQREHRASQANEKNDRTVTRARISTFSRL
jgi:hypothetical protein